MPTLPELTHSQIEPNDARCFGLRIENHLMQLAVATRMSDGHYQLEVDQIECSESIGWLTPAGTSLFTDALETLIDRHQMSDNRVAVSLDGHFCVTRVAMGTGQEVDNELQMQAARVPRYLQLGPGEKVTGCSRQRLADNTEYAITGVVNRSMIQLLYDALREVDINVTWVEPSLVSVARMLGQTQTNEDRPILIADGTGSQWDVGIACNGRLLLDYRPAAATDEEGLRNALDGHITRLKRFCSRHRGIVTGEMDRLLIYGSGSTPTLALETIGDSLGISTEILRVPNLTNFYNLEREKRESQSVSAVATVLPLLMGVPDTEVPDLLTEVRRAPDLPFVTQFARMSWPVFAALIFLGICFGLVSQQRSRQEKVLGRAEIITQIAAANARLTQLAGERELLGHIQQIEFQTRETNWIKTFERITQSLPNLARLDEFQVDADGQILIDGTVLVESLIFELIGSLRKLPDIHEVALTGTNPDESIGGTRFNVRMESSRTTTETEETEDWETDDE